jgi:hydroxyacylglutathione hydrolase
MPSIRIRPIPLFEDNYCWRIENEANGVALLVDPADAGAVRASLGSSGPEIAGLLVTHHHRDHSGGTEELAAAYPGVAVVGGLLEKGKIKALTHTMEDGQIMELAGISIQVLHTPCHTKGHVAYLISGDPDAPAALFTGDTLFAAGCGKFFEGSAKDMHDSLTKLAALPSATHVYCGHEYTVANLQFCLHVEPDNAATRARLAKCQEQRRVHLPTLPSSIHEELETNVFLRCNIPAVQAFTHPDCAPGSSINPVDVLARLREAKNAFQAPVE